MVYAAREDSELLGSVVTRVARGTLLDVGTASGYLARLAHERGCRVTAVDIDREAVAALRASRAPFRTLVSDRFARVRGRFVTIVCNPPYLPDDEELHDLALHGGPHGYEYIVSVIEASAAHLAPAGQLLFLISTLTKPAVVEDALKRNGYDWTIVAREKLFMEELLVYRATFAVGEPATLLGEGWRGRVYAARGGRALKRTTPVRAAKEAVLLRAANRAGIGPRFLDVRDNLLTMRRARGEPFDAWFRATRDEALRRRATLALLRQAYALDRVGIRKRELSRPGANVLVTPAGRVTLLDFERSVFTTRPANVPQLASALDRLRGTDSRSACAAYKRAPSPATFAAVRRALRL